MSEKKLPTLQHPFIDGLKNYPANKSKDLKKIRIWINSQPHLPQISDEYIYLFLHACYYHHDKTKHAIETYFTIRANTPTLFGNRDIYCERMQLVATMANLARLPKKTKEGYNVLMYVIRDGIDPALVVFPDVIKGFCMYNDAMLSEDGLAEGYVIIFDMKNIKIGHIARVTLPALRAFMVYIQEAHPARLKAIHIINTASFIHHLMRIVQPMIRNDLVDLIKFHRGNCPEGFTKDMLPMDYGGDAPTVEELSTELTLLMPKYEKWMRESEYFVADESKRVKKSSWWSVFNGSNGNANPNNLGFEETQSGFKNLSID